MRCFIAIVAIVAATTVLAADCQSRCLAYQGTLDRSPSDSVSCSVPCEVTVHVDDFIPCSLSAPSGVSVTFGDDWVESNGALEMQTCEASGSGTELVLRSPDGFQLAWTYTTAFTCDTTLRTSTMDAGLSGLALSVVTSNGAIGSWPGATLTSGSAACMPVSTGLISDLLRCYANEGDPYTLRGVSDTTQTLQLNWEMVASTTVVDDVQLALSSGTTLVGQTPQIVCNHNVGRTLVQVLDATSKWALTWTWDIFSGCAEALSAIASSIDPVPSTESVVVIIDGDQTYSWERDVTEQQMTPALSDREVSCAEASPQPSALPSASSSPQPSASSSPSLSILPVTPFVDCLSAPEGDLCALSFGYYNPNAIAILLPYNSPANQLVCSQHLEIDQGAIPTLFETGMHNNTFRVRFVCGTRGLPAPAWKLRTRVLTEVADQLAENGCSQGCAADLRYLVEVCAQLGEPVWTDDYNGSDTQPVLRCARGRGVGQHPECPLQAE